MRFLQNRPRNGQVLLLVKGNVALPGNNHIFVKAVALTTATVAEPKPPTGHRVPGIAKLLAAALSGTSTP
jgi:hypothetical protein